MRAAVSADPAEPNPPSTRATVAAAFGSISPDKRRQMIEIAAYNRAEARGFAPGGELQDWLEAEAEIDASLVPRNR